MLTFDKIDRELLSLLRENARYSIAYLAQKLNISRATVANRISRLEKNGIILGYSVELGTNLEEKYIRAWTSIVIKGDSLEVVKILKGDHCIKAIYDTNGRWDILVELQANSLEEIGQALERIRSIPGITKSETSLHLKRYI